MASSGSAKLHWLQLRFKIPVPEDLAAAMETPHDLEEHSRWFDVAATAASLDEFHAAVQY